MWNITNDYYDEHSRVNFDTYGNVKILSTLEDILQVY